MRWRFAIYRVKADVDELSVVADATRGVFGDFDDDGVSRVKGGRDGVEDVMAGVIPRDQHADDADGVVFQPNCLHDSQTPDGPCFRSERILTGAASQPRQFLARNQNLPDYGIQNLRAV